MAQGQTIAFKKIFKIFATFYKLRVINVKLLA
jgi:hypothetical protein